MLTRIILISLIITAVHVTTWDGMLLYRPATRIGELLDNAHLTIMRKPLFECLICMGGIYTLVIDPLIFRIYTAQMLVDMLCVIGLNTIISALICNLKDGR